MKIRKHLIPIFSLILISMITHWLWFFSFNILSHGDWVFGYRETGLEDFDLPRLWQTKDMFGSTNVGLAFWPHMFIGGALAKMNFDYPINERIMFLWPIGLLSVLSMYCLVYYIFRSKIAAWISAVVNGFNAARLIGQTGILTTEMATNISPILLLLFIITLKKEKRSWAIISGLTAFALSFYEFRIFYMTALVLGFYFFYHLIAVERKKNLRMILKLALLSALVVILPLILNLYWLLGMYAGQSPASERLFNRRLFGTSFVNILRAITFFPYLWTGGDFVGFAIQPIPLRFFLIPVFAFLGFFLYRKKNKIITFFALLGLLGILLAKMTNEPFVHLYQWLFDYWPGFKIFREGTKFYFYITLAYSVLIGAFFAWLWKNWKRKKWQIYAKYILTFGIAFLFLWNTKPLITGEIRTMFVSRHIPQDYLIFKDFILNQPQYFRTLWVPYGSRWGIYGNHHPKTAAVGLAWGGKWEELIEYPQTMTSSKIIGVLKQDFSDNFFDLASIKYVIIPIQDIANEDDFFIHYGPRKSYVKEISKISYLTKVDIGTEELLVYENKDFRPHLYTTEKKETIYQKIPYQEIDYQFINPTKYTVRLKNLSQPVYLNFSESYHPDWKIRLGDFHWWQVITDKNYFLPDKFHFENEALFSSFLINPDYIKSHYPSDFYQENPDGSVDLELTLFFRPQAHLYLGLIISLITLIGSLIILIIPLITRIVG